MYNFQEYGLKRRTGRKQNKRDIYRLQFKYMDYIDVDIELKKRRTTLCGNSAIGKSYLYNVIEQYAQEERLENIICLDIENVDINDPYYTLEKLKKLKEGLVIIDQADDIFRAQEIEEYVTYDRDNFYLIIGRKYFQQYSELAKPIITKTKISLRYSLNTV